MAKVISDIIYDEKVNKSRFSSPVHTCSNAPVIRSDTTKTATINDLTIVQAWNSDAMVMMEGMVLSSRLEDDVIHYTIDPFDPNYEIFETIIVVKM